METKIKNLFSRRSIYAQPYETAVAAKAPVKGAYPAAGNGLGIEDLWRGRAGRQDVLDDVEEDDVDAAIPPPIARHPRPRTVLQNENTTNRLHSATSCTRSGLSINFPPTFLRDSKAEPPPLKGSGTWTEDAVQFSPEMFTNVSRSHSVDSSRSRSRSSYVDILDAHDRIRPGSRRRASTATGFRNYGEDIADRNIVEFGDGQLDTSSNYTHTTQSSYSSRQSKGKGRAAVAENGAGAGAGVAGGNRSGPDARLTPQYDEGPSISRPPPHTLARPPFSPVAQSHYRIIIDDDTVEQELRKNGDDGRSHGAYASVMLPNPRKSSLSPHRCGTREDSSVGPVTALNHGHHNSTTPAPLPSQARGDRSGHTRRVKSPYSSASIYAPFLLSSHIASRPTTTTTTTACSPTYSPAGVVASSVEQSRSNINPVIMKDTMRDRPLGKRPAGKSISAGSNTPASNIPASGIPITGAAVAAASALGRNQSAKQSSTRESTDHERVFPLSSQGSSNKKSTETGRSLPTPPYSPTSPVDSGRRSRGNSASMPQSTRQAAQPVVPATGGASSNREMLVEGASEAPSLEGIVDLTDSVDTDVQTHHLPAVVHETIIPKVHTITEERIDREIHTHDIFHRIQPIIDVEVLPAKHYIQSPDGKSLVEIPATAVPGRGGHYEIVDTSSRGNSDKALTAGGLPRAKLHHDHAIQEPIVSSSKSHVTSEGYTKTESVIRHPPTLETGARDSGQSVPMMMNCLSSEQARHAANNNVPHSKQRSHGEEDLLYKNTGYGEEGMLPGLEEKSPTTEYGGTVGEATSFLRRKKEEKRKSMDSRRSLESHRSLEEKMAGLNVRN